MLAINISKIKIQENSIAPAVLVIILDSLPALMRSFHYESGKDKIYWHSVGYGLTILLMLPVNRKGAMNELSLEGK